MADSAAANQVAQVLRGYADRGVFRGFVCHERSAQRHEYTFRWLTDASFRLIFDASEGSLTFRDLLPNVAYRSAMDKAFRVFLRERSSVELPEHRRIDPERVRLTCRNRKGNVSVSLAVLGNDYGYATKKAVSLVNEIFHGFLRGPYYEYMVTQFNEPEE